MKAQIINKFGDPSVFELSEIDKPELKPGHVMIKVQATSVNPIDCKIRAGLVPDLAPEFPAILHGDVAGEIVELASDVVGFKVGDQVYGLAGGLKGTQGALAEYMVADAKFLGKTSSVLTYMQSAALPLVSITAWEALFRKAQLKAGQTILIHGGIGGVGHIAVQLAKWRGAKVYATVLKNADIELVKEFGADVVINAKEEDVDSYVKRLTNGIGFEVVFDTVGGANLEKSFKAAQVEGTVVTTLARSTLDLTTMHNKAISLHVVFSLLPLLTNHGREWHGHIMSELSKIIDANQLKPLLDPDKFTLNNIRDAHAKFESGKAHGKIVVTIE